MLENFILFKKNEKEQFLLGPIGYNNSPKYAFDKLKFWEFTNDSCYTFFLTKGYELLVFGSVSEQLIRELKKNMIKCEKVKISPEYVPSKNGSIICENGSKISFEGGRHTGLDLIYRDSQKSLISKKHLRSGRYKKGHIKQEEIIDELFASNYYKTQIGIPDESNQPPEWANKIISSQLDKEADGRIIGIIALLTGGAFVAYLIYIVVDLFLNGFGPLE